ncbi:nucleotide exchange factor GrpE [Abyssibius alkaniclasticus]|uniref:nucleotide exchange factor GrpE n=1 Tax=Abyssibius alkaniclasticus TaxID=2881234 RepID=UPI0023645278|nr:nucleotide exchange factor GrpE [Abyssibius alkaniclasticus]UPH71988.1 nucleotide exchange factor GrpE [Abyssibius alkaniclasticus]
MADDKDQPFLDDIDALEAEIEAEEVADEDGLLTPEDMQAEIDALKDRLIRALAEGENIRKRAERDRRDAEMYGGTKLARDLLSVHDNLSRALETIDDSLREQAGGLVEGLELTQRELLSVFERHRVVMVAPEIGDRFDAKLHQAMFEAPVPNTQKGSIIQVMAPGFTIGDRLLRAAHVGVSSNTAPAAEPKKTDAET